MGAVLEECRVREESEDAHPDVERRHVGDSKLSEVVHDEGLDHAEEPEGAHAPDPEGHIGALVGERSERRVRIDQFLRG